MKTEDTRSKAVEMAEERNPGSSKARKKKHHQNPTNPMNQDEARELLTEYTKFLQEQKYVNAIYPIPSLVNQYFSTLPSSGEKEQGGECEHQKRPSGRCRFCGEKLN